MGKYCAWQNAREIVIASSENCCAITLISNVWKMLFSYYADNVLKWGFTEQLIASCDSLCVPSELKVKRWFFGLGFYNLKVKRARIFWPV